MSFGCVFVNLIDGFKQSVPGTVPLTGSGTLKWVGRLPETGCPHLRLFVVFLIFTKLIPGHFVLYGCETWSLTLREERSLRVFENRVLRRIFEPKRDEVRGEWRKLHNEELNGVNCLPDIVRVIK